MCKWLSWIVPTFLVISGIALFSGSALAQHDKTSKLLEAYLAARKEIWAGELQVSYRRWSEVYDESGTLSSAFDITQNGLFFEHRTVQETTRLVEDGSSRVFYGGGPFAYKRPADGPYQVTRLAVPFDFRTIGLVSSGEWEGRCSLESMQEFLRKPSHHVEIRNDATDNLRVLQWRGDKPTISNNLYWTRHVKIDLSRGFVPTSIIEGFSEGGGSDESRRSPRGVPAAFTNIEHTSTIEWTNLNGTWVPVSWKYEEFSGSQGAEYAFEWASVNTPLDQRTFSVEALDLPDGTLVMNEFLPETPFVESIVGGVALGEPVGESGEPVGPTPHKRNWFLIANIAFCAVVALWIVAKKRSSS